MKPMPHAARPSIRCPAALRSRRAARAALAACLLLATLFHPRWAFADGTEFRPTASEIMLLPQFCWGQFNPAFKGKGAQYDISQFPNCGVGTNHYCPGLVAINRANRDYKRRGYWIRVAEDQIGYTVRSLSKHPQCALNPHVEQTASRLRVMKMQQAK
jgi:hypothetical protein